jgi:DNA repair photolyase
MTQLGELYHPKGKALETAQQVLQIKRPMSCNVAYGCLNDCSYCYIPYTQKGEMRRPKESTVNLVSDQLKKGMKPEGVFFSFSTDPLLPLNYDDTRLTIDLLIRHGISPQNITVLSKRGTIYELDIMWGATIVSLDEGFRRREEPNAWDIWDRIKALKMAKEHGCKTWVSMEPYPCPEIFKQELVPIVEAVNFVDFIIFGKWNYDKRSSTKEAAWFYKDAIVDFKEVCKKYGIRHHIKTKTEEWIDNITKNEK